MVDVTANADLNSLVRRLKASEVEAVRNHWENSKLAPNSIVRFDFLSKGWDRLASEAFPDLDAISVRFKRLTGLCTAVAWSQAVDDLLFEIKQPIRNDLELLEKEAQRDFDRAKRNLQRHRRHQLDDLSLMESIGSLLWTVRSNSMHGRKTTSGPIGPTNRDEQICELGAMVLIDLYRAVFPTW